MLKKERLEKLVKKRCDAVEGYIDDFCATQDPEALHRLRVEVKKLKALFFLIQTCSVDKDFRQKGFKKVYKHAGRIRTAHVNLGLLSDYHIKSGDFVQEQHRIIEAESREFCTSKHEYQHDIQRGKHALTERACDIRKHQVRDLFQSQLQQISGFFAPAFMDVDGLHETRMGVKNLMYIHTMLPAALSKDLHINASYLDVLQDKIGQWHDSVAIVDFLKSFGNVDGEALQQMNIHRGVLLDEIRTMTTDFKVKVAEV